MKAARWLPVLLGFIVGAAAGTYYAWSVNPVEYTDTAPDALRADFRASYLGLIASAYAGTGDLARAQTRLSLLPSEGNPEALAALAQQILATGLRASEARALALLAGDLGAAPSPVSLIPSPGSTRISATTAARTPTRTAVPPTRTATITPGAPFALTTQERICDPDLAGPLLQIVVLDADENPVPGVEVLVVWDTGQDRFFTGLKPELGLGYADFTMTPDLEYTVQIAPSQQPVTGVAAGECAGPDGGSYPASLRLTFVQP